jgi:nucleoside-triphosphatase THEP1
MSNNKYEEAFIQAYNHFDSQPLKGERLQKFYIDDFTKDSVKGIITTIRITERFKKMLVIGHRGCGKSTILNKVAEELKNDYHVVAFSAADVINMMDVETVDILLGTYLQVLDSVKEHKWFDSLLQPFKKLIKFSPEEVNFLGMLALKFRVEPESRHALRQDLRNQMDTLQKNLSEAFNQIQAKNNKDVLIIIDDLDKLETKFAERVFYENPDLLILPQAKIVYTFPLDTYYRPDFIRIRDRYEDQFISVVNLQTVTGERLETSQQALTKLIRRRIKSALVTDDAINYVIQMSGGLLRDLVKFMQDACKLAIMDNASVINQSTVEEVIDDYINDYYRVFDFPNYTEKVQHIAQTNKTVDNKTLVYLLRYLFVLEYRYRRKLWYDVHPCLNKALALESE